mmetsp:Transcript_2097/g.5128  ORF Transcript_2097/g.5128 Transcript_2097/m.5128 type:complete len:333 (-) Transcript_2097:760-1758(-)
MGCQRRLTAGGGAAQCLSGGAADALLEQGHKNLRWLVARWHLRSRGQGGILEVWHHRGNLREEPMRAWTPVGFRQLLHPRAGIARAGDDEWHLDVPGFVATLRGDPRQEPRVVRSGAAERVQRRRHGCGGPRGARWLRLSARPHGGICQRWRRQPRRAGVPGPEKNLRRLPAGRRQRCNLAGRVLQVRAGRGHIHEAWQRERAPLGLRHVRHAGAGSLGEGILRQGTDVPRVAAALRGHHGTTSRIVRAGCSPWHCSPHPAGTANACRRGGAEENLRRIDTGLHQRGHFEGRIFQIWADLRRFPQADWRARSQLGLHHVRMRRACDLRQGSY